MGRGENLRCGNFRELVTISREDTESVILLFELFAAAAARTVHSLLMELHAKKLDKNLAFLSKIHHAEDYLNQLSHHRNRK
jgi:hypothetical protein